jgi:hypothetical protein
VRPEGIDKLKEKINYLIGNRTRNLPACSIVPQPTEQNENLHEFKNMFN